MNNDFNLLSFLQSDQSIKAIESQLHDEQRQIEILNLVVNSETFKVYISKNKLYLIISFFNNKFNYICIIWYAVHRLKGG